MSAPLGLAARKRTHVLA